MFKVLSRFWSALSLRQTLFLGAGIGILLPAIVLAYFQITLKLETEVNQRVRVPMQQYAEVLASGVAVALWNVDHTVAAELVEAVMRNQDVTSVTVTDDNKEVFIRKQVTSHAADQVLREQREIFYNGTRIGYLTIELTTTRIQTELRDNLLKLVAALLAQVGISFAFIWLLFDHRIMRPLQHLKEGALRLAEGNLDQPLRWYRKDEIGSLAGGLDIMRANLASLLFERNQKNAALEQELTERLRTEQALLRSEAEILALNTSLEQRVALRTQELSSALERLTAAQTELVRAEKMAALGSLVAGIAHELNTPIGNSLTVASTLQDESKSFVADLARGLTRSRLDQYVATTQEGAGILMRGLRHAADLVSSFKQVAVDQTSVNRRRFDLRETALEILLTMGPAIRKTKHTVECTIEHGISLESFPGPFGQVLTNLVNNSLLHAFDENVHGRIMIEAVKQGADRVAITVRDNGNGIPAAHLSRVFDPFFTTKLGKGGSGLGLNIVYNLVHEALGGTITVSSPVGEGACFTLSIPLIAPTQL